MIIRVFRAKIREGQIAEFKRLVQEQSIPWLKSQDGMLGYFPGEPLNSDEREFVMVTLWRDLEAFQRFVGDNWQSPVVTEDEKPLVEELVTHHYAHFDQD